MDKENSFSTFGVTRVDYEVIHSNLVGDTAENYSRYCGRKTKYSSRETECLKGFDSPEDLIKEIVCLELLDESLVHYHIQDNEVKISSFYGGDNQYCQIPETTYSELLNNGKRVEQVILKFNIFKTTTTTTTTKAILNEVKL